MNRKQVEVGFCYLFYCGSSPCLKESVFQIPIMWSLLPLSKSELNFLVSFKDRMMAFTTAPPTRCTCITGFRREQSANTRNYSPFVELKWPALLGQLVKNF